MGYCAPQAARQDAAAAEGPEAEAAATERLGQTSGNTTQMLMPMLRSTQPSD